MVNYPILSYEGQFESFATILSISSLASITPYGNQGLEARSKLSANA
jgi:hypothetical protein